MFEGNCGTSEGCLSYYRVHNNTAEITSSETVYLVNTTLHDFKERLSKLARRRERITLTLHGDAHAHTSFAKRDSRLRIHRGASLYLQKRRESHSRLLTLPSQKPLLLLELRGRRCNWRERRRQRMRCDLDIMELPRDESLETGKFGLTTI